ncbi:Nucleoside-triphosphatase [sediment metagenome]|uniref:Nucleoside-triphosphatase n=1 Tax=sediment metagenome TaxID=749907 RepID=D9PI69_9ZZZZ
MMRILLATTNKDKLREYRELLKGIKFTVAKKLPAVAETGKTYRENAMIKAKAYGEKFNALTVVDDTGLEVRALNNTPGIYSNRFAGGNFVKARKEILKQLKNKSDRRARFVCVLALYFPDSHKIKTFTGTVSGKIAREENLRFSFGYDPIFLYPGPKMQVGHRFRATKKLIAFLKKSM